MNPNIFKAMKVKKKREVDPNAPPRPTLLGHEKEMKVWREQFNKLTDTTIQKELEIQQLKRKVNRLESQLDAVISVIKNRFK
jgi:predicted  nucleic acid-binding Zn-ribbon protein